MLLAAHQQVPDKLILRGALNFVAVRPVLIDPPVTHLGRVPGGGVGGR